MKTNRISIRGSQKVCPEWVIMPQADINYSIIHLFDGFCPSHLVGIANSTFILNIFWDFFWYAISTYKDWWTGAVPVLIGPLNETVFNHFPRATTFTWAAVPISGVTYTIEVDAFGARNSGQWATQTGEHWLVQSGITGTSFNHNFVGAQRGRWRVKANISGLNLPWSEWRYFRYTH